MAEISTYFGRCRCCLQYNYLKHMWSEYEHNNQTEVYGEMLVECFALTWANDKDSVEQSEQDKICSTCIKDLRNACSFKDMVLQAQETILQELNDDVKDVRIKLESNVDDASEGSKQEDEEHLQWEFLEDDRVVEDGSEEGTEIEYLEDEDQDDDTEIEYLEDDEDSKALFAASVDENEIETKRVRKKRILNKNKEPQEDEDDDGTPKPKYPRKLPKHERNKTYKQYTEEDMRNCLDAIKKNELTLSEAAELFKIPKKTVKAKLRKESKDNTPNMKKEKSFQFIQEIKKILTYTNATPFKSKANRLYCIYCPEEKSLEIENSDELRSHTRNEHIYERTSKIEYTMRPLWMNEILKLDIHNLICTVCCIPISGWGDMFKHLKEQHSVSFTHAFTRVIPFLLTPDIECALCKANFVNFMQVDSHMNAHYNNYVCAECGDTFICDYRLKQHYKTHYKERYPCSRCPKVFTMEKFKQKHEEQAHERVPRFKCQYCEESFGGELMRHTHVLEKHEEHVKTISCELCEKTFTWRPYYANHMRKVHSDAAEPTLYQCEYCGKEFVKQSALKKHKDAHEHGQQKYACGVCHKIYLTLKSLKKHLHTHQNVQDEQEDNIITGV